MKIKDIFKLLQLLLSISEQVSDAIAESSIPKEKQKEVEQEVQVAMAKLETAKTKIDVEPTEEF